MPGRELLTLAPHVEWVSTFSKYIENQFKPDSAKAKSIVISDLFKGKFRFTLKGGFTDPPDTNSIYYRTISTVFDSLLIFQLIDIDYIKEFKSDLLTIVRDSVISFRKEHVRRDHSLKLSQPGITLEKRFPLLTRNRNEFQKILNIVTDSLYIRILEPILLVNLSNKLEIFTSDSIITYNSLIELKKDNFERVKEILKTNIIKNPYIDLELKAEIFLLLILLITIIIYLYFSILAKYFTKLERVIECYNIVDTIKVSNLRNITSTLNLISFTDNLTKIMGFIFYTLLPVILIGIYTKYLFSFETTIIIMTIVIVIKFLIWVKVDHNSSTYREN